MDETLSFGESCERTLIASKVWLVNHLPRRRYGKVYVLGSWYGNMGLVMQWMGVRMGEIINVDTNPRYCRDNGTIYQLAGFGTPFRILNSDGNTLDMGDADLVINTSTNDIETHGWFSRIPSGCTVAIQCRNHQGGAPRKDRPDSYGEFEELYKLSETLYRGRLPLNEDGELYSRYMIIGRR